LFWWRGLIRFALQNYAEAIADLTDALAKTKADERTFVKRTYVKRAHCYLGCGQYSAALEDLDRASELNPGDAPTQFWYAVTRHLMRSGAEISQDFAEAAHIAQATADPGERNILLARISLLTGHPEKAVEHHSTLIEVCNRRQVVWEICAMDLLKKLFPDNHDIENAKTFLEGKINMWDTATITVP
jgi:tetratricopeptide (TPR) repeat protein